MRGTAWTVAMRWGMRGLGLISTVVLARLLTPEDFGLVAMAMVFVALSQVLTDFGVELAVIRDKNAGSEELNTAWSIRMMQRFFVAGALAAISPLIADFYGDARLTVVVQVISVTIAIGGLENIGIVNFRRELDFGRDFRFNITAKIIGVGLTIALAVIFRSYWALIWGQFAFQAVQAFLSYVMCSYRPRWNLSASRSIWGFSRWFLLQGMADFIYNRADAVILGRALGPSALGRYSISQEVAYDPMAEIAFPVARAVGPGFAQLIDEPDRTGPAFVKVIAALATVLLPIGLGLASVAEEAVPLVLGDQWVAAIPLVQVFASLGIFGALGVITSNLMVVLGYIRKTTLIAGLKSALFAAGIFPAIAWGGLMGAALLKGIVAFFGLVALLSLVARTTHVRWQALVGGIWRPFASAFIMLAVVGAVHWGLADIFDAGMAGLTALLASKVLTGGITYFIAVSGLWILAGRPDGLEKEVADRLFGSKSQAT